MATKKDKAADRKNKEKHAFYSISKDYKSIKDIVISKLDILGILRKNGFVRHSLNSNKNVYIHVKNNIAEEVTTTQIWDFWFNYLDKLEPYTHKFYTKTDEEGEPTKIEITNTDLIEKFLGAVNIYLSETVLDRLTPEEDEEITFLKDTKNKKFIYYKNGFVTITKSGVEFTKDYSQMDGYIWNSQILDRLYNSKLSYSDSLNSYFYKFMFNISGQNPQRLKSLQTIIGYLCHDYFDYKLKSVILTDAFLSEDGEANGRTGKGLFNMGLKYMFQNLNSDEVNYLQINGKTFDPKDEKKYGNANHNTKLIHLEDVKAYFNIEDMFNDVTDGALIRALYEKGFKQYVKFILSSNKSIRVIGSSAKDRTVMYEFAEHYNDSYSPQDEFNHWFFKEWNTNEWQLFDVMMCHSIAEFFKAGKIIEAETINLDRRVLLEHTSREFVTFLDYYRFNDDDHKENRMKGYFLTDGMPTKEHNKKELYEDFTTSYPDYAKRRGFNQSRFTKWLKLYANNSDILQPLTEFDERRSNGKDYITFKLKPQEEWKQ